MMNASGLCLALCLAFAPQASAQAQRTDKGFLNLTIGAQAGSDSLATASTFDLYRETARVTGTQDVGGGLFFDLSGGYTVWRNLALGIGFSRASSDSDVRIDASIPDPLFFDSPRSVTASAGGAKHSENAVHIQATWKMPVTSKIDVALSFGPTIFNVEQDLVTSVNVTEPGPAVSSSGFTAGKKTAAGFNLGFDVTYMVTPRVGAGFLARYTRGSAEFDGATDKVTVGGFQAGAGARVRF